MEMIKFAVYFWADEDGDQMIALRGGQIHPMSESFLGFYVGGGDTLEQSRDSALAAAIADLEARRRRERLA